MGKQRKKSQKTEKMKFLIFGILSSSVKAQSQESACDQLFAQQLKVTPNPCKDRTFAGKCRQKCPETVFEALPRSATELCIDAFSFCGQIKQTQCNIASVKMGCKKTRDACDEDFTAQIQQDEDSKPKCTDERFCGFFFSALPCNSPAMANNREKYYDDCPVACGNPDCIAPVTPEPATTPVQDSSCTDESKYCNVMIMGKVGICKDPEQKEAMMAMCKKSCSLCDEVNSAKATVTCRDYSKKCSTVPLWRCSLKRTSKWVLKLRKLCPKACQLC